MRRFSIFKRNYSPYYYAQIKNPDTGRYMQPKSTGRTEESEALLVVADWLHNGIPQGRTRSRRATREAVAVDSILHYVKEAELTTADAERIISALQGRGLVESATMAGGGPDAEPLIRFLERFWNYEESPYVREKLAYGHAISRRHCYEQTSRIRHWREYFGEEIRLRNLDRGKLQEFQFYLNEKGLKPKTINSTLSVGTVAFSWATDNRIIATSPAEGLRKFSGSSEKRGILTPEQVVRLFSVKWNDRRARVGNLVAMTTGLRAGEVVALRREDIGGDRLYIRHSWSFTDGLKAPKNGETREAPLLPQIRAELLQLAEENPYGAGGFLFFHHSRDDRPCDVEILRKGLHRALVDMELPEADRSDQEKREKVHRRWLEAGISFHSWRHYYAAHMADRVDIRTVQLATGHKSAAMAEHYADHAQDRHFKGVAAAARDAFGRVLQFPGKEATG
jgi:integrase